MYGSSILGRSCWKANTTDLVSANIYLHVESRFFPKILNNAEIRMLCNDGIKLHNFRIKFDMALLSTCSIFSIKPREMAVVLRRKT